LLVCVAKLLPHLQDCRLEVAVDVCDSGLLSSHPFRGRLRPFHLGGLLLFGLSFRPLILGLLLLLLFLRGFPEPLSLGSLSILELLVYAVSDLELANILPDDQAGEDLADLRRDAILAVSVSLDLRQQAGAEAVISKGKQPVLKFLGSLVKGDPSVYQGSLGIVVILHGKKSLTEGG
jgi:hypothetical protein